MSKESIKINGKEYIIEKKIPFKDISNVTLPKGYKTLLNKLKRYSNQSVVVDWEGDFIGFTNGRELFNFEKVKIDVLTDKNLLPQKQQIDATIKTTFNINYPILKLIKITATNTMFKIPVKDRIKLINNKFKYVGYKYVFEPINDKSSVLLIDMYFYIQSSLNRLKRMNIWYQLIARVPYLNSMGTKKFKRMNEYYNLPIKLFSSDPSFKYYLAYALRQRKLLIETPKTRKWLGKAFTTPPLKRNPDFHIELTKHFYKMFNVISKHKPYEFLDKSKHISEKYIVRIRNKKI